MMNTILNCAFLMILKSIERVFEFLRNRLLNLRHFETLAVPIITNIYKHIWRTREMKNVFKKLNILMKTSCI